MHDLAQVVEATRFCPPAWQAKAGAAAPRFPWWFCLNSNAQQVLQHLGLPPIQVRSDHTPWRRLRPPLPAMWMAEGAKAALGAMARLQQTPPDGDVDVLAILPQRGWEGQGRRRDAMGNEYLGTVLHALKEDGRAVATASHLLEGGMGPARAAWTAARRGGITGVPHLWLEAWWDDACRQAARQVHEHFQRRFAPGTDAASLGFDATGEQAERLVAWLRTQSLRLGLYAGWFCALWDILETHRVRAVATTMESFPHHRVMLACARAKGVPSVSVQHGWIGSRHAGYAFAPPWPRLDDGTKDAVATFTPDRLGVYGTAQKETLLAHGPWRKGQVEVVGSPRYDTWVRLDAQVRDQVRSRLGVGDGDTLVLWATQTHGLSDDENGRNVAAWHACLQAAPDIRLAVKLHPMEDQSARPYRTLREAGAALLGRSEPIAQLMLAADVVATKNSTCAIEAAGLQRGVVVLNLTGAPLGTDFVSSGMAVEVGDPSDLERAVRQAAAATPAMLRHRRAYVRRNLLALDGQAGRRVADLMAPWLRAR